jgi:hypothetical protein
MPGVNSHVRRRREIADDRPATPPAGPDRPGPSGPPCPVICQPGKRVSWLGQVLGAKVLGAQGVGTPAT